MTLPNNHFNITITLACIIVGGLLNLWRGEALEKPQEFLSTALAIEEAEGVENLSNGRASGVIGGQLRLEHYAFGRNDTLVCQKTLKTLKIKPAIDSAPLKVQFKDHKQMWQVEVTAKGWRLLNSMSLTPINDSWSTALITQNNIESCRISPQNGIGEIAILGWDDSTYPLSQNPFYQFALGAITGAFISILIKSRTQFVLCLAALFIWSFPNWNTLAESLALTQTSGWTFARIGLIALLAPLLLCTFVKPIIKAPKNTAQTWWVLGILSCSMAVWQSPTGWSIVALPIALFPGFYGRKNSIHADWLKEDIPALLIIGLLGWQWGLIIACIWRLARIVVLRQWLLDYAPKFAADSFSIALISLVLSCEIGIRTGYLNTAWDPTQLEGNASENDDWRKPKAFWKGECKKESSTPTSIVYLGGSSTGGAYQFGSEPEAFYSAKLNQMFCQSEEVQTWNYGAAERDTYTISRTIDTILKDTKADWLVLYVGHNDFTADNPYSRLEREKREGSVLVKLAKLARKARIIAGSDLLFRALSHPPEANISSPPLGPDGTPMRSQVMHQGYPMAVPLEDARVNILEIQAIALQHNTQIILIPQIIAQQSFNDLSLYWEMESQLAQEYSNIHLIDVRNNLRNLSDQQILVDNNHFSRNGHKELANALRQPMIDLIFSDTKKK